MAKQRGFAGGAPADKVTAGLANLVRKNRYADVQREAKAILSRWPNNVFARKALGFALLSVGDVREALPELERALQLAPGDPELHNNLGIAMSALLRWDEAMACYATSLRIAPANYTAWKNLGATYYRMARLPEAAEAFVKAIEAHPGDYYEAIGHLASSWFAMGLVNEAHAAYRELAQADPKDVSAYYHCVSCAQKLGDWGALKEDLAHLLASSAIETVGNPFFSLSMPGVTADMTRRIAARHVLETVPPAVINAPLPDFSGHWNPGSARRLRVAYFSSDFRDHPVGYLMAPLVEAHSRGDFEWYAYSFGPNDGDATRQRFESAFDHFIDVDALAPKALAERIRADEIDILVALNGWTSFSRGEVLGLRPAPVQVNWLGYAGTMGHPRLADFVIGDAVATPDAHAAHFSEQLLCLPQCYLPFDSTLPPPQAPTRPAAGLPEGVIVFSSHNNLYKLNPQVFDLWCRILVRVPTSVLWLSNTAPDNQIRLCREAEARGVQGDRIFFAARVKTYAEHLDRLACADIALDPFPYNGHTSSLDAIWAGMPLVTVAGETFPSRVGASAMTTAGLADLIAADLDAYESLAVRLATDADFLQQARQRVHAARSSSSLFDIRIFAAEMETAFKSMWAKKFPQ